ncbi:MAG: ParB N-terminal domain-containing protein [Bacteroidales bacterium]|jgi:ParB/RepB/Spo0J family partition protein
MKPQAKKTETKSATANFQKETYLMVPPSSITVDEKKNPRIEYGEIEELMLSIVENGIRNPLKGYEKEGKIILKDGYRRMRAVKLALEKGKKIERVPIILEKKPQNEEERTLEYMIYNDGKPLTMLEQSEVIRRLINFGWKVTDIVKKTGKARGYIENLTLLNRTTMKVQHHVKEGKISANAVVQIMQAVKGDAEKAAKEVESAITKAKETGKEKATPKHVETKQVRSQSFGKFYKWAEEIADTIAGKKEAIKQREEVLTNLLVYFENGKKAVKVAEEYFIEKKQKA